MFCTKKSTLMEPLESYFTMTLFHRNLGSCSELLLLHFSSFTIGRRLEVTVGTEEEKLLQPSRPYCPLDVQPHSAVPSHVITVSAPRDPPRYGSCCPEEHSNDPNVTLDIRPTLTVPAVS